MVNLKIRFIIKTIPAVFGILQHFNQTTIMQSSLWPEDLNQLQTSLNKTAQGFTLQHII